ncbi:MAG: hypothetical protein JNL32_00720 [Candidatus Kapabacteria bacterium]|nr:hypothetical protein [Candidatus Kapabacteria bacterium]
MKHLIVRTIVVITTMPVFLSCYNYCKGNESPSCSILSYDKTLNMGDTGTVKFKIHGMKYHVDSYSYENGRMTYYGGEYINPTQSETSERFRTSGESGNYIRSDSIFTYKYTFNRSGDKHVRITVENRCKEAFGMVGGGYIHSKYDTLWVFVYGR